MSFEALHFEISLQLSAVSYQALHFEEQVLGIRY